MSNIVQLKIGLFDSGIGGFSILKSLIETMPFADYLYVSDNAHAPYGPKSDEFITERAVEISQLLIDQKVDLIVVACNTATAASIDYLRNHFKDISFVGVEPYLNAYYKLPENKKVAVLTTVSTGKSERFKRLKERLDPNGEIVQIPLENLAFNIEKFYAKNMSRDQLIEKINHELIPFQKKFTHVILGCTHYPLVKKTLENVLMTECISPCPFVAHRAKEVLKQNGKNVDERANLKTISEFSFYETKNPQWILLNRSIVTEPFTNL